MSCTWRSWAAFFGLVGGLVVREGCGAEVVELLVEGKCLASNARAASFFWGRVLVGLDGVHA